MQFNVKDKSLNQFFKEYGVEQPSGERNCRGDVSSYHLMQDVIYIKQLPEWIKEDWDKERIIFILEDRAMNSGKALINTYTYEIKSYDSVCWKLVLIDFKVEAI